MFSCEFCETFKNTFFYRTPLVADSVINKRRGWGWARKNDIPNEKED